jgi:hypothetical protein
MTSIVGIDIVAIAVLPMTVAAVPAVVATIERSVDAKTILRLHRIARITLSSEIIFNLWYIVLRDLVGHKIQPVLVKREAHLVWL